MDAIAHAPRRDRHHASELAAAEHADGRARQNDPRHGKRSSRTLLVCSARNARSRSRSSGRDNGENRHREQPGVGRARLADGQRGHRHAAGHLHDRSSESSPLSAALCTGTPSTGSAVCAAVMPGRCAAPPAPGDDHLNAARLGALRELRHPHRRPVRRHDVLFVGHAETLEHLDGMGHRVPVRCRAHDDGDERLATAFRRRGSAGRRIRRLRGAPRVHAASRDRSREMSSGP